MAILPVPFDANGIEEEVSFEPIPPGEYLVQITDSEVKENKSRTGSYLNLTLTVLDNKYQGRLLFDLLNLYNQNQTAVEIAEKRMASYCRAMGLTKVSDSMQLHGIPFKVRVAVEKDPSGQYKPKNKIVYIIKNDDDRNVPF